MLQKEVRHSLVQQQEAVKYDRKDTNMGNSSTYSAYYMGRSTKTGDDALQLKSPCILECYYDKELQCCGSCFRTLEEIAEAGKRKKNENSKI